jgi:hypothetical protein
MQFPSYLLNSNVNTIILYVKYFKQKYAILLHKEMVLSYLTSQIICGGI